jgi:hypothetical protein
MVQQVKQVQVEMLLGAEALAHHTARYALIERVAAAASDRGVAFLGFGIAGECVRLVLAGDDVAVARTVHGVKAGTARQTRNMGAFLLWSDTEISEVADVAAALDWAHHAGGADPMTHPWTSLRDLLGLRRAPFYDADVVASFVDRDALAARYALPAVPPAPPSPGPIGHLLRVAAAVRGVLPGDRTSFRLFVHLARAAGVANDTLARALCLTDRRIRQLVAEHEPMLGPALVTLADPRLAAVP